LPISTPALKINPRFDLLACTGGGWPRKRNGSISEGDLDINNAKAMDPNIAKGIRRLRVQ